MKGIKKFFKKLASMKETILVATVIVAAVIYIMVSTFKAVGFVMTDGFIISGSDVEANLTADREDAVELVSVNGDDTLYQRFGNIYVGETKKTKVNTEFPMYVSGGAAIRFMNNGAVLLNESFVGVESYDGLVENNGTTYNIDGSQADPDSFIFAKLSNGFYINTQELEIETVLHKYTIPENSVLLIREDSLDYYEYHNGYLTRGGDLPDLSLVATVRIGDLEMTYKELLIALKIYTEKPAEGAGENGGEDAGKEIAGTDIDATENGTMDGDSGEAGGVTPDGEIITGDEDGDEEGEQEGYYNEAAGIAEDSDDVAGGSGSSGKKKSNKNKGSGGGGGDVAGDSGEGGESAVRPAEVETPGPNPTQVTTTAPPETTMQKPEKGKKTAIKHDKVPAGAKENPDWKDPVVVAGTEFDVGIYTLYTTVTITDPGAAIINGVTYEIVILDDYGAGTLYKRVTIRMEESGEKQSVLISGLKPDSKYSITGTYRYMDKYGRAVQESRTFFATREFETKPVSELGAIKVDDFELFTAEIKPTSISIPHIRFTEESDRDAIGSLAKASVRFDEGKPSAVGCPMTSTMLERLKSYQAISYTSEKVLEPAKEYTFQFLCYDQFYNQLRVEDSAGNSVWTSKTCYELPKAKLTMTNNDTEGTVSIDIKISNPAKLEIKDLKLRVMKNGSAGTKSEYIKLNGTDTYLPITEENLNGTPITITSPGKNSVFVASVWCICDNQDGTYQTEGEYERSIGSQKFTTTDLENLGALYITTENITKTVVEAEAAAISDAKKKESKQREVSTRGVIKLTLNTVMTNSQLYNEDMALVDTFTVKITSGEEKYKLSLTDEELHSLLYENDHTVTIDTNDTDRFPFLSGGLTSNTTYSLNMEATHWYDDEGQETADIRVSSTLSKFKTAIQNPEVNLIDESVAFFEGFIYMDVQIVDLDGVIDDDYAILSIYETDSGTAVGSFRITKNQDYYQLRLKKNAGAGETSYDIKANMNYTCDFIAVEAHPESGYQINYVFASFTKDTGKSLTGKVYSMGLLNSSTDGVYDATFGYEVSVPTGDDASDTFKKGKVYIDIQKYAMNGTSGKVEAVDGTLVRKEFPYDENGIHPDVNYYSVRSGTSYTLDSSDVKAGLANGTVKEYDIPSRYQVCEYIESRGSTYIDTEYHADQDTSILMDTYCISNSSSYAALFGLNDGSWSGKSYAFYYSNGSCWSNYNNDINTGWGNQAGKRLLISRKKNELDVNGKTRTDTYSEFETTRDQYLYLNAINWGGSASYYALQRIYGVRIWDDGELERDYVPCYDTETNKYGLYDLVHGRFDVGQGNGSFAGEIDDCRYYLIDGDERYRLSRNFTQQTFKTQMEHDNADTNYYSYEMYFLYQEGTKYEEKVPLSNGTITTEQEIYTIASGQEFVTKGANAKKYVVINDISYDNRDISSYPLDTLKANIDFQGFTFNTYVNYQSIVKTSTRTASISNMKLVAMSGLLKKTHPKGRNWYWYEWYRGGSLFANFYGKATNLYIEFSQEEFPYIHYKNNAYTFWSTQSAEEIEELENDEDDTTNPIIYFIQPTISSFVVDNYGQIENFVVDLKTDIHGVEYVGGLACANRYGGTIRNGYVFSSKSASLGEYTGSMKMYYGYYNNDSDSAIGGVVGYEDYSTTLENCYSIVDITTYTERKSAYHAGSLIGMTRGSTAKVRNSYSVGNLINIKTDSNGLETSRILNTTYGPTIGMLSSGSKASNLYYISDYVYSSNNNTPLSSYALSSPDWQNNILNSESTGFTTDSLVNVGFFPQVIFSSVVMPSQVFIPLPEVSTTQNKTDVAYAYDYKNEQLNDKVTAVLQSANYGNEAWNPAVESTYYDSNEQVLCILLAEEDKTRIVYSVEIEHFNLTHEDILYQHKDGSGIISVYVRLHNPDKCLSQYQVKGVTYQRLEGVGAGSAGVRVDFTGKRYAEVEYYKQIKSVSDKGEDSWIKMVQKYENTEFPENMVLKNDLDFSGYSAKDLLVRGKYSGTFKGAGYTIRNLDYDPSLATTFGFTSTDNGMGLFKEITGGVNNLTLDSFHIEAGGDTGALCGTLTGGSLDHVFVKNSYIAGGRMLGGIAGYMNGGFVYNSGVIDSKIVHGAGQPCSTSRAGYADYYTGGITGLLNSVKLQNSFVQNVYIESMYVDAQTVTGGLVGYTSEQYSYIDGCYATGTIHANSDFTGGLIGVVWQTIMSFTNCYADVDVYAYNYRAEPLVAYYTGQSTACPSSVISFGSVIQAVDFDRADDNRKAEFYTTPSGKYPYEVYISFDEYKKGNVYSLLSSRYFASSTKWADGELPKLIGTDGEILANQQVEYIGQEYGKENEGASGISVENSSLKITQKSGSSYGVQLTIHHNSDVTVQGLVFGFNYVDDLCGMTGNKQKLLSFTESEVFDNTKDISLFSPNGTTTTVSHNELIVDAAYDRYFVTAVKYKDAQGNIRYQRVGLYLSDISKQWKEVASKAEWEKKIYGTHGENFHVTGNIDFENQNVVYHNNTANNIVNRLVGTVHADTEDEYLNYKKDEENVHGTNPYVTIKNLSLSDGEYNISATKGLWQRYYCRGLVSVVNSELAYLTFEDDSLTTTQSRFGIIGALTGQGHHLILHNVSIANTGSSSAANLTGFVSMLKDGFDNVYIADCTLNTNGSYCGILAAYMYPYTHNNWMRYIYAEDCTVTSHGSGDDINRYDDYEDGVATGLVLGCAWRGWGVSSSRKLGSQNAQKFENITITDSTLTADGRTVGLIAGVGGGTVKNCTVKNSSVTSSTLGAGSMFGTAAQIEGNSLTADHVTVKSSGYVGGITGRTYRNMGLGNSDCVLYKNCVVKDSTIHGTGYTNQEGYMWCVGGISGYMQSNNYGGGRGYISNTIENNDIKGSSGGVGGILGFSEWACRYESNTVKNNKIQGKANVGGLQGGYPDNETYKTYIEANTVCDSSVLGTSNVGGLIGYGGNPYRSNKVQRCTIVGTEYNVGGAVGRIRQYNTSDHTDMFDRKDNGYYSTLVEDCYIFGRAYVGGAVGSIYRVGVGDAIVRNCEVRGYYGVGGIAGRDQHLGTAGTSGEQYLYPYDCYVTDTLITEMDDETNGDLKTKFGLNIPDYGSHMYFGGIVGYAGQMRRCLADNCIVSAPNSSYVGGLQGLNYLTWTSGYAETFSCASKNGVVVGKEYVGGLFGGIQSGYNSNHLIQTERLSVSYCYSDAKVVGENYVGGIAGIFAADTEKGYKSFNPTLKELYFTGSLEATGTGGKAAAVFAYQDLNQKVPYKVAYWDEEAKKTKYKDMVADDYFYLDGIVSMPSTIKAYKVYSTINTDMVNTGITDGVSEMTELSHLNASNPYCFVTLWSGTTVTENNETKTMADLLTADGLSTSSFASADYANVIDTTTGARKTDDARFILLLSSDAVDSTNVDAEVYKKALRSGMTSYTGFVSGAAYGNLTADQAKKYMPLFTDNSIKAFANWTLSIAEKAIVQGVPIPASTEAVTAQNKQDAAYTDYISSGNWDFHTDTRTAYGPEDIEKFIRKNISVYPSGINKVTVAFSDDFYTEAVSGSVTIKAGAKFSVQRGNEGYYVKPTTWTDTRDETEHDILSDSQTVQEYSYNFLDTFTVKVNYQLQENDLVFKTGTVGIVYLPEDLRDCNVTSYLLMDGEVYLAGESSPVLQKSKAGTYKFRSSAYEDDTEDYYPLEYLYVSGKNYIDTGVLIPESEVYLDFMLLGQLSNTYILGEDTPDHDFLIGFNSNCKGFGYFYTNDWSKGPISLQHRYTLHTVGRTGDLHVEIKENGAASYTSWYYSTSSYAYVAQYPEGIQSAANLPKYTIKVGGVYDKGMNGRIYGCKIYSNGELVRDYIPVYKSATGTSSQKTCGLLDLVTGEFKSNAKFGIPDEQGSYERGTQEWIHLYKNPSTGKIQALDAQGNIVIVN